MTPTAVRRALAARPDTAHLARAVEPDAVARSVSALADARPDDPALADLAVAALEWALARAGIRAIAAGHRLGSLVRWDARSATFEAATLATGAPALVRVLRPRRAGPLDRAALLRDGRALAAAGLPIRTFDGPEPALATPLPGGPLLDPQRLRPTRGLRAVVRVLADLEAREAAGLGAVDPDELELRETEDGARLVTLAVRPEVPPALGPLAATLADLLDDDAPILPALLGATVLPPRTAGELADAVRAALASDLAGLRHAAHRAHGHRADRLRRARLEAAIARLQACRAPRGEGRVGFDLDGHPTQVTSDDDGIRWGPIEGPSLLVATGPRVHAAAARRLLRARASTPAATGASDAPFVDALCRWLAGAVTLASLTTADAPTG